MNPLQIASGQKPALTAVITFFELDQVGLSSSPHSLDLYKTAFAPFAQSSISCVESLQLAGVAYHSVCCH